MADKQSVREYFQNVVSRIPRPGPDLRDRVLEQLRELAAAVRFLTVIPVPGRVRLFHTQEEAEQDLTVGGAYFPLVGLLLAALLCVLLFVTALFLPSLVVAALIIGAEIVLTGGLHLDGLMDSCDGLFGGSTIERRLEIMRDSRVGSFGVLGAGGILLLKFALFASMSTHLLVLALVMALPVARWGMLLSVSLFPGARLSGLGTTFRRTVTNLRLLIAAITALIVVLIAGHLAGLLVLVAGTLVAVALGTWVARRLGGLTGDIYGAIEEVTEVVLLLLIVALHFWF